MAIKNIYALKGLITPATGGNVFLNDIAFACASAEAQQMLTQITGALNTYQVFMQDFNTGNVIIGTTEVDAVVDPDMNPGNLPLSLSGEAYIATVLFAPKSRIDIILNYNNLTASMTNAGITKMFTPMSTPEIANTFFAGDIQLTRSYLQNLRERHNLA